VELNKEMVLEMKNAKLEVIPKAGHFPFIDSPENFTKVIYKFLIK